MNDLISRKAAIDALYHVDEYNARSVEAIRNLPSAEVTLCHLGSPCEYQNADIAMSSIKPEEVIPHRNYKYLSDYWCECGWHLGKKGEVKYCADCGRKVNWDG